MANILIAEDDPSVAEFVGRHLRAGGHRCTFETSGPATLEAVKRAPQDLLLLDVMLPGCSGFEVCRRIRKDDRLYLLPIIILSAMNGEAEILHGLAQGADDYIVKPFEIGSLLQRVEALLRASASSNQVDSLTALPSGDRVKRELQRKLSRGEAFGLAYIEFTALQEFTNACGKEARNKAVRHLGRALQQVGESIEGFMIGHLGGGHFVCTYPPQQVEAHCRQVRKAWVDHLEALYGAIGHADLYRPAQAGDNPPAVPILDLLFCVTVHDDTRPTTPKHLFETLSRMRNNALATKRGGVYVDRRD